MTLRLLPQPALPPAKVISLAGPTGDGDVRYALLNMHAALAREHGAPAAGRMMTEAFLSVIAEKSFDIGRAVPIQFSLHCGLDQAFSAEGAKRHGYVPPAGDAA